MPGFRGIISVGAVLTDEKGQEISTGFTREFGEQWHAEHVALEKAARNGIDQKVMDLCVVGAVWKTTFWKNDLCATYR